MHESSLGVRSTTTQPPASEPSEPPEPDFVDELPPWLPEPPVEEVEAPLEVPTSELLLQAPLATTTGRERREQRRKRRWAVARRTLVMAVA